MTKHKARIDKREGEKMKKKSSIPKKKKVTLKDLKQLRGVKGGIEVAQRQSGETPTEKTEYEKD